MGMVARDSEGIKNAQKSIKSIMEDPDKFWKFASAALIGDGDQTRSMLLEEEAAEKIDPREEERMKSKLYDLYQLDWMMSHGYSLGDVFTVLRDAENEAMEYGDDDDPNVIVGRFYDEGFGGEIFASYNEFCDAELNDEEYIGGLIGRRGITEGLALLKTYKKYRNQKAEEE